MSAVISVKNNPDGSWTASGQYGGVYARVTCTTHHQAVIALEKALYAFEKKDGVK